MIRLSEAMARLYCKDEVQPKHVKEAFRLLNKSIIRVETPDIDFDEEEQQQDLENGKDGYHSLVLSLLTYRGECLSLGRNWCPDCASPVRTWEPVDGVLIIVVYM